MASYNKLEKFCLETDHRTIQKMIETDLNMDKILELKCAFNRKCSECCLGLMKVMDFDEIRLLTFDQESELDNIPHPSDVDNQALPWKIPILYLAMYAELLDVVEYIVETAHQELKVGYGGYSILEFVFTRIDNVELHNFFLKDEIFMQCVRIISSDEYLSDLVKAFKYEGKFPRTVVEKILDLVMECENQFDRCWELQFVIIKSLYKPRKLKLYLDILLQKNKFLLDEVWIDGYSFFSFISEICDIEFIEEIYVKYKPNLLFKGSEGTVFHRHLLYIWRAKQDFNNLAKKLLEWEPKLAEIPDLRNGYTPLMIIGRVDNSLTRDISRILVEEYNVDINAMDFSGNSALYHATTAVNLHMMLFLLNKHASLDNLTIDNGISIDRVNYIKSFKGDEIQEIANDVMKGSLTPDVFNSVILCLIKVFGARIQDMELHTNDILNDKIIQTIPMKDFLDRFQKVYSTLSHYRILDFNSVLKEAVKFQIENSEGFKDAFIKYKFHLQMSLATAEIHFDKFEKFSPYHYYDEAGFKCVKEFISIQNLNSICSGREMPSLKHLCRSAIRKEVFKTKPNKSPIDLFTTLEIPNSLKKYLCFLDDIPIDM